HGLTQDSLENTRIDGYTLIGGFCRKLHKKGGVAGYVKNELEKTIKLIRTSNEESELVCETALFEIKINKEVIQVLGTYRPPTSNIEQSIDILTDQLESAMQTTKPM
ncbi:hypothetical protein J6590_108152, partial [Homalodisca vitripennis]